MPLYAQVQFGDSLAADYPQWETGEEGVVFTTQVIAVATRRDQDGDVRVEVWTEPVEVAGTQIILDTEVQIIEGIARFGNELAGQLFDLPLRPGWHRIRVLTSEPRPSVVRFVLDSDSVRQPES